MTEFFEQAPDDEGAGEDNVFASALHARHREAFGPRAPLKIFDETVHVSTSKRQPIERTAIEMRKRQMNRRERDDTSGHSKDRSLRTPRNV